MDKNSKPDELERSMSYQLGGAKLMDKNIEAVEGILEVWEDEGKGCVSHFSYNGVAREICQLFEPKPSESRLLTDEEIKVVRYGWELRDNQTLVIPVYNRSLIEAQDTKTASIKDQGCQQRVERIKRKIEKEFPDFAHTEKIDCGFQGDIDEWNDYTDKWQALWKEEGI